MKYRLNKLPVKTTNGFKINDVEVELEVPKFNYDKGYDYNHENIVVNCEKKKGNMLSKIGLEIRDYYYEVKIKVLNNTHIDKLQYIPVVFGNDNDTLFTKLIIEYEDNSYCDFIFDYKSINDKKHFNYVIEEVISNNSSNGSITIINAMNKNSVMLYAIENDVLENASITHNIIDLGGVTRLYNVYSNLNGINSNNYLNTLYIGMNDELLDFNYYSNNIGVESNNQMKVEGVIGDNCIKNFRGTIDFKKGCTNSIGEENENCVLLTDTCRSRSLPQLLCGEENVVGAHGVSSGKVSEEKMFYLMSRGYSKKEAEKLIVIGNFMGIINGIPSEDVKERILEQIEKEI